MPSRVIPAENVGIRPHPYGSKSDTAREGSLTVLISANTSRAAKEIDETVSELLAEYGYDVFAPEVRIAFTGSPYYIKYRLHRRSEDLEEDLEIEFGEREASPRKRIPASKRSLLRTLKDKLEKLKIILVVGGVLFASVAAGKELYENFLKAFHAAPPATEHVQPAQQHGQVIFAEQAGRYIVLQLPPAMVPVIENAEQDPEKVKLLLDFLIANHLAASPSPPSKP
jgi:hypothetical protein